MTKQEFWEQWHLETTNGRQTWVVYPQNFSRNTWETPEGKENLEELKKAFQFDKTKNPNANDRIFREQKRKDYPTKETPNELKNSAKSLLEKQAAHGCFRAIDFMQSLQTDEGHFPADYGGPLFLTPGLVIASYLTETPLPAPHQALITQYFLNHQNPDGGWGLHIEGSSILFTTVLQYVALRLLGMEANHTALIKAREWILKQGGATYIPSWGKFYLTVLGIYEWEGCNSLLPEMWLLPKGLPFHPSKYWCHSRMVYLPMAYCFGHRVKSNETPLLAALKTEIHTEDYVEIDWIAARAKCAATDQYHRPSRLQKVLNFFTNSYERCYIRSWRKKGLDFTLEYIEAEDEQTSFIDIGPVNQVLNSIAIYHAYGKDSEAFQKHVERWYDYLWVAEDGMKMNGYNGSQLWDNAFLMQAVIDSGMEPYFQSLIQKSYSFLKAMQIKEEVQNPTRFFRHQSVGAFPFSTIDHGWPISDCTAEGLKAALLTNSSSFGKGEEISELQLKNAVDVLLSLQNADGGWATYENTRGGKWLELLNPSELFGNIMVDYSYVECSSAAVQGLLKAKNKFPNYKQKEIAHAVKKGLAFIHKTQRKDGSWYGSWAVCFTYGTWFGVEGLVAAGEQIHSSVSLQKACAFLVSKQNSDGGWGESFESCIRKEYVPHHSSQVVNTAWALLSLMAANYGDKLVIKQGIEFLLSRQLEDGNWLQESISGVFNHNCMISYTNYRNIFPLWALGRYSRLKDGGK